MRFHSIRNLIVPTFRNLIIPLIILLVFLYPEYYIRKHTSVFIRDYDHFHRNALLSTLFLPLIFLSLNRWIGALTLTLYTGFLLFFTKVIKQVWEIGANNVEAIAGTSWAETSSTLADNIPACLLFLCLLTACFWAALKICRFRPVLLAVSLCCVAVPWGYHWSHTVLAWTQSDPNTDSVVNNPDGRTNMFFETYPGVPGILVYGGYKLFFYKDIPSAPHAKQDEMILSLGDKKAKNIIIVLGESATAYRHGYLNYDLQTTPFASNLIAEKKACSVEKAHSVAPLTNLAVPRILSFQSVDHPEKLYDRKNLIELASQAGYKTYWIGNQTGTGPYASRYGYISRYADFTLRPDYLKISSNVNLPDKEVKAFHAKTSIDGSDDLDLLAPLKTILEKDPSEHKFIILHLWGSHFGYSDKSDEIDRISLPDNDAYDRSIHHTDRLLEQVTKLAKEKLNQQYVLFYTSDHGEDVPREGHGIWDGNITQYEIPMLLTWGAYEAENGLKYCGRIEEIRSPNGYFSQTMDKILLSEIMGYQINPETVKQIAANDRVIHTDSKIYVYPNVRTYASSGEIVPKNTSLP